MVEASASDSIGGENIYEFRMRLEIAAFEPADPRRTGLLRVLERDAGELRPALASNEDRTVIELTADAEELTAARAVKLAVDAASDALGVAGLDSFYVKSIELLMHWELNA